MLGTLLAIAGFAYVEGADFLLPEGRQIIGEIEHQVRIALAKLPILHPPSGGASPDVDLIETAALLDRIRVEPEHRSGYDREAWPHWNDENGNCLHAREEVLIAESVERAGLSPDGCAVTSGVWRDAYTGEIFRDPSDLDIDHVVALQEAHDSGGWSWSRARRTAFANDLEDPRTLIAVSAAVNRSKSAYGPEEWLPPNASGRCSYVADWIVVKARWGLSMDESERVAVGNILDDCREQ